MPGGGRSPARYDAALDGGPLTPPMRRADAEHVFHQYVLRSPHRAEFMARLKADGVGTGIHYPAPVHLQSGLSGPRRAGPRRLRRDGAGGERGVQPADVSGTGGRAGGAGLRRAAGPGRLTCRRRGWHPRRAGALDGLASPRTLHAPPPARAAPPPRCRRLRRRGDPDRRRGHGPSPKLPPPHQGWIPTINIAPARGWAEGATPKPRRRPARRRLRRGAGPSAPAPRPAERRRAGRRDQRPEAAGGRQGHPRLGAGQGPGLGRRQDRERQPHHPAARRRP